MTTRRQRIMWWLWSDDRPDWLSDRGVVAVAARLCCRVWGHQPQCDQCHRPEHDHCTWCWKPMPGQAHRAEAVH